MESYHSVVMINILEKVPILLKVPQPLKTLRCISKLAALVIYLR